MRFKAKRCATLEQVRSWVEDERRGQAPANTDRQGRGKTEKKSVAVHERPCESVPGSAELVANAALSLLNLACYLLDKQLAAQEKAFVEEGGFTERLYRVRSTRRK
jgi:four helix bundle suffix protein